MKSFAVIFNYSFDSEATAVYLFDTQQEAIDYLRDAILEEYRIDTEENGWDPWYTIDDNGLYGLIRVYFPDHIAETEARVGSVYC